MVKSGDAMRGVPALFVRDGGADPPWWAIAQVGAVHAAGWMDEGLGANRGLAEVVGEVGAISCRRGQFSMAGQWNSLVWPLAAATPRDGRAGGERMNPLKRGISRTAGAGRGLGG